MQTREPPAQHLAINQVWRAKSPRNCGGLVNDRQILHVSHITGQVQYDGPAVAFGRHYPKCTIQAFLRWADREVTDELPNGEWMKWEDLK